MFSSWEQPGGPGSSFTISYSYSNLLDGGMLDGLTGSALSNSLMRSAFERAFQDYADILPIHFIEVLDNNGPLPETGDYDPTGLADIRIGHVPDITNANAYAYFPSEVILDNRPAEFIVDGLAGDIVFNAERSGFGWNSVFFYAVAQHEIGHSLGMGHFVEVDEISAVLAQGSTYTGPLFPLTDGMVSALQGVYGAGLGSVTPIPLPPALVLFLSTLGMMLVFVRYKNQFSRAT